MKGLGKRGFTLVELAIVLIIIGILLGMIFKGGDLISSAKEKRFANNLNKITSAIATFYGSYNRLPGDGCLNPGADGICSGTEVTDVCLDGVISRTGGCANERNTFWTELINSGCLQAVDRYEPVTHKEWRIGDLEGTQPGIWIETDYSESLPVVCAADKMVDDGNSATGDIRDEGGASLYNINTDCKTLAGTIEGNYRVWR